MQSKPSLSVDSYLTAFGDSEADASLWRDGVAGVRWVCFFRPVFER